MGQKINPKGFRLGVSRGWDHQFYTKKNSTNVINVDHEIFKVVEYITTTLLTHDFFVGQISSQFSPFLIAFHVPVAKFDGQHISQELVDRLQSDTRLLLQRSGLINRPNLIFQFSCHNIAWHDFDATLLAKWFANEIELDAEISELEDSLTTWFQANSHRYLGLKVSVSGRINGAEMALTQKFQLGHLPLQTLRYPIDFFQSEAFTISGVIGISVWIAPIITPVID